LLSFAFKSKKVYKNFKDYLKELYESKINSTRLIFLDSVPFCGLDVVENFIIQNYDCKLFSEAFIDSRQLDLVLEYMQLTLISENDKYE